ncbi:MAG TPA: transposase [Spirochaetota bacterium]|nr:transposase [Spirochaetota bacterium]
MTRMRLKNYDYRNEGHYFITIVTKNRAPYFARVEPGKLELTQVGIIAREELINTANLRGNVFIDEYVVMPDHIHFILILSGTYISPFVVNERDRNNFYSALSPESGSVSVIVRLFKAAVTRRCRESGLNEFSWQPGFYDRIIRDQGELNAYRRYIATNPERI